MSGYRYPPFGGDGRRPAPAGRHYYEQLRRHEPTTRPASSISRPIDRSVEAISGIEMKQPPRHPQREPMDTGEDDRDDSRSHREMADAHNAGGHRRGPSLTTPHESHSSPPAVRALVHPEDHAALHLAARRRGDWQYEAWLKTKGQYPISVGRGRGRGRPPQMRQSYPITGPVPVHSKQILGYGDKNRVRDINVLEQEMRHRMAASVLGEAPSTLRQLPFTKPPPYHSRGPVRGPPSFDSDASSRTDHPPGVGPNGIVYRNPNARDETERIRTQATQDKLPNHVVRIQSGSAMPVSRSVPDREKRPASTTAAFASHDKPTAAAAEYGSRKRQKQQPPESVSGKPETSMLDLLCSATLEVGPLKDHATTGCSCSKSHCIKLYCECFKARRHCTDVCACAHCKNTVAESGTDGVLTKAIRATLARNPNAFSKEKVKVVEPNPGELVCRCVKSRCLKLYCDCFQGGQVCGPSCSCISCLNTAEESVAGGRRAMAIRQCLEKRPDAFEKKVKSIGSGCACKNNRCLKKYCDCFRYNLSCGEKCTCKDCGNLGSRAATVGVTGTAKAGVQNPVSEEV